MAVGPGLISFRASLFEPVKHVCRSGSYRGFILAGVSDDPRGESCQPFSHALEGSFRELGSHPKPGGTVSAPLRCFTAT